MISKASKFIRGEHFYSKGQEYVKYFKEEDEKKYDSAGSYDKWDMS